MDALQREARGGKSKQETGAMPLVWKQALLILPIVQTALEYVTGNRSGMDTDSGRQSPGGD